jgi:HAD superfamily hydrolase (TIGR01662 family)
VKHYVLLDRDGTLIRDAGYPHRLEDYELLDGVAPALRRLADAGYRLAIVTNQSGIGRGLRFRTLPRAPARRPPAAGV